MKTFTSIKMKFEVQSHAGGAPQTMNFGNAILADAKGGMRCACPPCKD
jgi:hypothetical protein